MTEFAEAWQQAVQARVSRSVDLFHVVGRTGYNPLSTWERRPDGLYELAGSPYAFEDKYVRKCTATSWAEPCRCEGLSG
jgi:hypothetical protein